MTEHEQLLALVSQASRELNQLYTAINRAELPEAVEHTRAVAQVSARKTKYLDSMRRICDLEITMTRQKQAVPPNLENRIERLHKANELVGPIILWVLEGLGRQQEAESRRRMEETNTEILRILADLTDLEQIQ